MKFSVNDVFKNSFAISTNDKLYQQLIIRLKNNGLIDQFFPKKINGIPPKFINNNSAELCTLAHFNIINMAKTMQLPYVTIFEEDAYACNDCIKKMDEMFSKDEIPEDADIVLFGQLCYINDFKKCKYLFNNPIIMNNSYIKLENAGMAGAQSYIVFQKAYDKWLDVQQNSNEKFIPSDGMFALKHAPNLICYSTTNSFFIQNKFGEIQHSDMLVDKRNLELFK